MWKIPEGIIKFTNGTQNSFKSKWWKEDYIINLQNRSFTHKSNYLSMLGPFALFFSFKEMVMNMVKYFLKNFK